MCLECRWEDRYDRLAELIDNEKYRWAYDTLSGIKENIKKFRHITDRQAKAVQNIINAVNKRGSHGSSSGSRKQTH